MSSRSKREYLEAIYPRYKAAARGQKKIILDEFCAACGYHRKHPSLENIENQPSRIDH